MQCKATDVLCHCDWVINRKERRGGQAWEVYTRGSGITEKEGGAQVLLREVGGCASVGVEERRTLARLSIFLVPALGVRRARLASTEQAASPRVRVYVPLLPLSRASDPILPANEHLSSTHGKAKIARGLFWLLFAGIVDARRSLYGDLNVTKRRRSSALGPSPSHAAVARGRRTLIRLLVAAPLNVDTTVETCSSGTSRGAARSQQELVGSGRVDGKHPALADDAGRRVGWRQLR